MFLGEYQHTVDAKGRISLPAKFRGQTTGRLVVSKGMENCLYIHPVDTYEASIRRLIESNEFDPESRRVRRFFTSGATEIELDSAGRVTLSAPLRAHAGLQKDVTIIGNVDKIEVWDTQAWDAYNRDTADRLEDAAAGLADKGIL